jgi:6-phosphogluconolactonase
MRKHLLTLAPIILGTAIATLPNRAADMPVLFGTHRSGTDIGFSLAHFNPETGALSRAEFVQESEAPSFFVLHPDGKYLYTCNSIGTYEGKPEGTLSAFAVEPNTGRLTFLNRRPTGGADPCHVSLDHTAHYALTANYDGGNICVYALQKDGSLGKRTAFVQHTGTSVNPQRQAAPHPHSIALDSDNRFALVPDLGADKVFVYRFDDTVGSLAPNAPPSVSLPPGSGPRHSVFHPNRKLVYVINELSNSITAFRWNSSIGTLSEFQTLSTLPPDFKGTSTAAEIQLHPNGRFLYGSNRGHDSIAVFAIDPQTGRLTPVEHAPTLGAKPRHFDFDPTGKWMLVCNHDSNSVTVFRVDDRTGKLTSTGRPLAVPDPFCAQFLPQR